MLCRCLMFLALPPHGGDRRGIAFHTRLGDLNSGMERADALDSRGTSLVLGLGVGCRLLNLGEERVDLRPYAIDVHAAILDMGRLGCHDRSRLLKVRAYCFGSVR